MQKPICVPSLAKSSTAMGYFSGCSQVLLNDAWNVIFYVGGEKKIKSLKMPLE